MPGNGFTTTSWTVVLGAKDDQSDVSQAALSTLCETYWHPLYSYMRRKGYGIEDAEDLTQEFFARFLEYDYLKNVEPSKGRFRSFLLASLNHFLANERAKSKTQKRGGHHTRIQLDFSNAEQRYALGPSQTLAPEVLFDAEWARTVIETAFNLLEAEFAASGKAHIFSRLKSCLSGAKMELPYTDLSEQLNMSEGAIKVAVHRMRKRYGTLLRNEIMKTVEKPEDVEEELKYLIEIVGS